MYLARLVAERLPEEPEALGLLGLLALLLHCEARRDARREGGDTYVPLRDQDPRQWRGDCIEEAEALLRRAGVTGAAQPGRFQLEAAIQSVHAARRLTGRTDWALVAQLYEGLIRFAPTVGALVGRAAAMAELRGPGYALGLLDEVPEKWARQYQAAWAVRADLLRRCERYEEARAAYDRAVGLTRDASVREFLMNRRNFCVD